jgi:hypothetical protein
MIPRSLAGRVERLEYASGLQKSRYVTLCLNEDHWPPPEPGTIRVITGVPCEQCRLEDAEPDKGALTHSLNAARREYAPWTPGR